MDILKGKVASSFQAVEQEFMRDMKEVEERRRNILIFGLSESSASTPLAKKEADSSKVCSLASELGVVGLSFRNIFRLGKPSDKPRPIKLIGLSLQQREDLLRSAPCISQLNPNMGFRGTYIRADLSLKEREVQRQLRLEVASRRENGENAVLRNGRIVTRLEHDKRE